MRIPPPVWAGAAGLTQLVLARRARPTGASLSAAAVVGVASAGLGLGAVLGFRSRGTTIDPMDLENSRALVTGGVFARTRNPMYLALAGLLAAHGIYRRRPAGALPVRCRCWASCGPSTAGRSPRRRPRWRGPSVRTTGLIDAACHAGCCVRRPGVGTGCPSAVR